jgi:hypothetical protein
MSFSEGLPTAGILAAFTEEIEAKGGTVTDTFDDGTRLFTRSVLSRTAEVTRGDRLQAGVALRAVGGEVWLHPYVFRQVCRNGAIVAQALQTRHLTELHLREPEEAAEDVREAVGACCAEEAFTMAAGQMRSAREAQADLALNLIAWARHFPGGPGNPVIRQVMDRFFRDGDSSVFGLMNAVTAVARDTRDPQVRWDLEEFGGGIPALRTPKPVPDDAVACRAAEERALLVG